MTYFECFYFSGRAKYLCEHISAMPYLHKNHSLHFLLTKVSTSSPHSHHTMNKCTLIILYLNEMENAQAYNEQWYEPCIYIQ